MAACSGDPVVGGRGDDVVTKTDAGTTDIGPETAPDVAIDTPAAPDVADDLQDVPTELPPGSCRDNTDCAANEFNLRVCEQVSGRCVQCTAGNRSACGANQYCTAAFRCEDGCDADMQCVSRHCDTARHVCVGCRADDQCPAGQICSITQNCVPGCNDRHACPAGESCCTNVCRDLQSDRASCGGCGMACPVNQVCSMGSCQISCGAGLANCSDSCRDLQSDRSNCGACGMQCPEGQVCSMGRCQVSCSAGLMNCAGDCRDLQSDRAHCGRCDNACPEGQVCRAGTCQLSCATGFTVCMGACRDLQSDLAHCGACGRACAAGQVCSMGVCAASCGTGQTVCMGACTNTRFDPANCGACGTACGPYENATATCNAGRCVQTCAAGFADCNNDTSDGCERNLNADLAHCGRCGNACPTRANAMVSCAAGVCGATCAPNFADCDGNAANGCETDTRVSAAHCGRCGNACALANATATCVAGACAVGTCTAPFRDCDGNAANGCENDTRTTCGGCDLQCRDRTVGGAGAAAFDPSGQRGTAVDPARGGLVVSGMSTTTTLDFLWVVNTAESTIGKWDATAQREVARYRVGLASGECRGLCCYNNGCNMPSRVVVDGNGDAYVANRGFATQGSVTKLAAERTSCVDRNGNGMIDTSSGPTDVLPYGQDECVLWTANVGAPDAILRAITADRGDAANPFGYVWVGGYNSRLAYRLNPRTGALLGTYPLAIRPYGMVVTRDGRLWISSLDSSALQSIDTTALTVGPAVPYPVTLRLSRTCAEAYGLTADARGRIWLAGWGCRDAIAYDPAMGAWTRVETTGLVTGTAGRGITVDATGRVWMTYATMGDTTSGGLLHWNADAFVPNGQIPATAVTRVPLPGGFTGPSGLGVDRVGNVWLAHYLAPSPLVRYTPSTGSSVVLFGPNQVYSYSDFTGSVRRTSIAQGTYEEVIDLGCAAPTLTTFTWNAATPMGTSIRFVARTAPTVVGLGGATAVTVALAPRDTAPVNLATIFSGAMVTPARQFLINISMQAAEGGATPALQSFNIGWRCPAP